MTLAVKCWHLVTVASLLLALPIATSAEDPKLRVGLWPADRLPNKILVFGSLSWKSSGRSGKTTSVTISVKNGKLLVQPGSLETANIIIQSQSLIRVSDGSRRIQALGNLRLSAAGQHIRAVLSTSLEDYTARVLTREMPSYWPEQALAAQAVVARSFALASHGRHANEGYDVCTLTHCQLWSDVSAPASAVAATRSTAGIVLTCGGRFIATPFSSTCGGKTADGTPMGMAARLKPVSDGKSGQEFCRASTHFRWKSMLTPSEIGVVFGIKPADNGDITFRILSRDNGGRVTKLEARGAGVKVLDGGQFLIRCGRMLGWARIKSCLFQMTHTPIGYSIVGRGLGHGVGLCQWGARGRALAGQNWRQIIRAYYPGTTLLRL